jgi:DNA-binding transcriptional MerR regulator
MATPLDKTFTTSALVEAAGCTPGTFRAWRNRNGLFPETAGKQGWNRFSVVDVCITRVVVVMTRHGLPASAAIDFCEKYLRASLFNAWEWPDENTFCTFEIGSNEEEILFSIPQVGVSLEDLMKPSNGVVTVIGLRGIVEHVRSVLPSKLGKSEAGG